MRAFLQALSSENNRTNQTIQTKRIIQFLLQEGAKTIPEIKDFSGLSLPTTTKLINELIELNILVESGKKESSGGRPPSCYKLNSQLGYIVGVELLINSFRLSIVNLNHELIYEYETDNFDLNKREEALGFIIRTVPEMIYKKGITNNQILGVGIGITGRVDSKNGISYSYLNFEIPLVQKLQENWGYPVFVDNDTRLMTLGEQNFGLARDCRNVIYVNLSRGIAIGLISNGNLHSGESGFAGEFGHIYFEDNNKQCVCGKKGCLETEVSGYALERKYHELYPETSQMRYREILQLKYSHHSELNRILIEMGEKLGKALSILVQSFNPGLIVVGGRFSSAVEFMKYPIMKGLSLNGLPQLVADVELKSSILNDNATMLGAYALVMKSVFD